MRLFFLSFLFLGACSFAPIPLSVNLLETDFPYKEGSFQLRLPTGSYDILDRLDVPRGSVGPFQSPLAGLLINFKEFAELIGQDLSIGGSQGFVIDFTEESLAAEISGARLNYELELALEGPVSADVRLQAYLAPVEASDLITETYKLGEVRQLSFSAGPERIRDSIELNEVQRQGIAEKRLRLALHIEEGQLLFVEPGQAQFRYTFQVLQLAVDSVRSFLEYPLPNAGGLIIDTSQQDLPAWGRIINLGLDYHMNLELGGDLQGELYAQLYLGPEDENIIQQDYAFGTVQKLELNQSSLSLSERAFLGQKQLAILKGKNLRVIMLIRGNPDLLLGQTIDLKYRFNRLELFGGYSLN